MTSKIVDIERFKSVAVGCCFMLNNSSNMCVILKYQSQTFWVNQSIIVIKFIVTCISF